MKHNIAAWVLMGGFAAFASVLSAAPPPGYQLIWSDEFDGDELDDSKWAVNEPGKWGDLNNTPDAVSVADGSLKITTYTQNGKHYAAVVGTQDRALFTYGYYEARMKFSTSPGAYSAFWIMSPTIGDIIGNPEQSGTEIDIVEHRAVNGSGDDRQRHTYSAVHWDGYGDHHKAAGRLLGPHEGLNDDGLTWNVYGLLWTPTGYTFYVDGREVWSLDEPISQVEHYLLLSTLVDDNSWAGNIPSGGYGSKATSQTYLLADYVRVYHAPEPSLAAGLAFIALLTRRRHHRPR